MKKINLTMRIVVVLLTVVSSLWASGTRLETLGYMTNFYLVDSYNIWIFPSTVVQYNNNVFLESEIGYPLYEGGVNLPITPQITMGLYMSNSTMTISYSDVIDPSNPNNFMDQAQEQLDLFGGYSAEQYDIGLHLARYANSLEYTNPDDNNDNYSAGVSSFSIDAGLTYKPDNRSRIEGTISFTTRSFKLEAVGQDPDQATEPYGHNTIALAARYLYSMTDKVVLAPFLGFSSQGEGFTSLVPNANPVSVLDKETSFILGVGFNIIPRDRVLVTCATGMASTSSTTEISLTSGTAPVQPESGYMALPFVNIGLEAELCKWMGFRLSMYKLMERMTSSSAVDNNTLDEYKETSNPYSANMGVYFRIGRLKIDTLIDTDSNADFLHNGPYLLSGHQYTGNLFKRVSVIYSF